MNPQVDPYFIDGCGRCPLYGTPQCKVNNWREELLLLRSILLDCGLNEELKWSIPCYTFQGNNVLILAAFKDYCSVSFFKGALLKDPHRILKKPGENTQADRLIKFTNTKEVVDLAPKLRAYIIEAIAIEKAGLKVSFKKTPEPIPEELQTRFDDDTAFESAFYRLTPGRQRGYVLYFSAAKQSKTREARIEKYYQKIMHGIGFHDR